MANRLLLGYLAAASAICIYAGMFTVGRAGAAAGLDGYDQTALRFLVSTIVVLPFGIIGLRKIIAQIGLWRCVALAILNGATYSAVFLGSGLIDQSQKMTVAAMQMAEKKVWAHLS